MSFVLLQNFLRKEIPCTASVNLSSIDTVKTPIKRALVDDSVFRIQYPVIQYSVFSIQLLSIDIVKTPINIMGPG